MISTLPAVRAEIAEALAAVDGLYVYDVLPTAPELPCAVVRWPELLTYTETLAGHASLTFRIGLYCSSADDAAGQGQLAGFVTSIPAALAAHTTTTYRALNIVSASDFRTEKVGEATAYAFDITTTLLA